MKGPKTTAVQTLLFLLLVAGTAGVSLATPFPVATTAGAESALSAAFDGTNYLVGIQGDGAVQHNITAQLVSLSGTLPGSRIPVGRTGGAPMVAFDGTNYLMVWFDDAINEGQLYGVFINKAGSLVEAPFIIDAGPLSVSRNIGGIAFGGGNYLAVYYETEAGSGKDKLYGRLISPAGAVGTQLAISSGYGNQGFNNVAFDGTNFLVVWNNHANNTEVMGRFVSPTGTLGTEVVVKPSGLPNDNPLSLGFSGTNYLVAWTDEISAGNWDVFGQIVTPAGVLVGGKISISTAPGQQFLPLISFDGLNSLVSWTDGRNDANGNWACDEGEGTCLDIYGQFVSTSGALVDSEFAVNNDAANQLGGFSGQAVNGKLFGLINSGFDMSQDAWGDVYGTFLDIAGPYLASGTYAYVPGTPGTLTLNTTSSDFTCQGPPVGEIQLAVLSVTETTAELIDPSKGEHMNWIRTGGSAGDIGGTWQMDGGLNADEITFNTDLSFQYVGNNDDCGGDSQSTALVGTWGVLHLQYEIGPGLWSSEASRVTFNGDGTGTLSGMKNDETNAPPDQIKPFSFSFTYSLTPKMDGSFNLAMTVGLDTFNLRIVLADNGSMAIMDGTDDPNWANLSTMVKIDTAKTYSNSDLSGDYYGMGYERNRGSAIVDPPDGNGAQMAISSVETFNSASGTFDYFGQANSIRSDGTIAIWADSGFGAGNAHPYAVNGDGSVSINGGGFRGFLAGDGAVGIGSGSFAAEGPDTWAEYIFMKKGDRSYATADVAGTWALVSLGDDKDEYGQSLDAQIGTITCDSAGQCSSIFKDRRSDGSTSISNKIDIQLAVAADGSFGASLAAPGANPPPPAYAGAIGNAGNTMIFNSSFDPDKTWHREIFIGVRASYVGDLTDSPSIAGQIVAGSSSYTSGNIYVSVYNGPRSNGNLLNMITLPSLGEYVVTGLPADTELYVYARWDKDGGGYRSPGDWSGQYAGNPLVITGGTNPTDITISLDNEALAASVSGHISSDFAAGLGDLQVFAYGGPDTETAYLLDVVTINSLDLSGTSIPYTLSNLVANGPVYLFARWDRDGDGVSSAADYLGSYSLNPLQNQPSGHTGIDITLIPGTPVPQQYIASGTYVYVAGTPGSLTLTTTSSDFSCQGPPLGEIQLTVLSVTETAVELIEPDKGEHMNWTRTSGTAGDLAGTWWTDVGLNADQMTFNTDLSFEYLGYNDDCGGGGDEEAPTTPTGLVVTPVGSRQMDLSWTPSTDNVGVEGYNVYRDGNVIGTATTPSFSDGSLASYTRYCYTVQAYDGGNNFSNPGGEVCATTHAGFAAYSFHNQDGYFIFVFGDDPNQAFSGITVNGPGVTGEVSMSYNPGSGRWEIPFSAELGTTLPTGPSTYTFTATPVVGGDPVTGSVTVSAYVEKFATNLQPTGTVTTAQPTFSWTGFPEAGYYAVIVGDLARNWLWSSPNLQAGQTSVLYDGPPLAVDQTYLYSVIASINTDGNSNSSFADAQFTYTDPSTGHQIWAESAHDDIGGTPAYYGNFFVPDPDHSLNAVTVSGPGIIDVNGMALAYRDDVGEWWTVSRINFGQDLPVNLTYDITLFDNSGTRTVQKIVNGGVEAFAVPISPQGNYTGDLTFTFTGVAGAESYRVSIGEGSDPTAGGSVVWVSDSVSSGATTVTIPYSGPPLMTGAYNYIVHTFMGGNSSMARAVFNYTAAVLVGDLDGNGIVAIADAILALQTLSGLPSLAVRADYGASGADVNGDDQIGMVEALYILQHEVDLRPDISIPAVTPLTPYTADADTVLLDHFDNATGASILAYSETGASCGPAKASATPNFSYGSGPDGLNQDLALSPPVGQPAGSTTYLNYPGGQLLSQANGTIEFWVHLTSNESWVNLVSQGPYPGSCAGWTFGLSVSPAGQLQAVAWAAFDMNSGTAVVPLNTWTHVAATWGSDGAKLYLDGVLVGSDTNTGMPASGYGGSVMVNYGAPATTQLDELRISNVQRTAFSVDGGGLQ